MIHRILPTSMGVSSATISDCTAKSLIVRQLQCFALNDELVAVEDSLDVGNVLWIFYDCLCKIKKAKKNANIIFYRCQIDLCIKDTRYTWC